MRATTNTNSLNNSSLSNSSSMSITDSSLNVHKLTAKKPVSFFSETNDSNIYNDMEADYLIRNQVVVTKSDFANLNNLGEFSPSSIFAKV
jgi:hypothetical protein